MDTHTHTILACRLTEYLYNYYSYFNMGTPMVQWLEHYTGNLKVVGSMKSYYNILSRTFPMAQHLKHCSANLHVLGSNQTHTCVCGILLLHTTKRFYILVTKQVFHIMIIVIY